MYKRLLILFQFVSVAAFAQQPAFNGGRQTLNEFLTSTLIYPEYARQNCIAATIQVGFKLDKSGKVTNTRVVRGLGIDLDDEAVRVVKMTSGKWTVPATYDNAEIILPIRFDPDPNRCIGAAGANTDAAIAAYKIRQEQENAVTNYYKNKYLGKADPTKEASIIALKDQLGFDDELINDILERAKQKQKQGDKEGACEDWQFIRNIGSNKADSFIAKYCK